MRMRNSIVAGIILVMFSCTETKQTESVNNQIEVASQLKSLTRFKASDYLDGIEYIPLETTDSSLIGADPTVTLLEEKIMVNDNKRCLMFDRKTGKFLCSVGHIGNDPEGCSSVHAWVKANTDILYFPGWKNELMKYDTEGNFLGKVRYKVPEKEGFFGMPILTYLNKDTLLGYYPNIKGDEKRRLLFFNDTADSLFAIPNLQEAPSFEMDNISVLKGESGSKVYGMQGYNGVLIINAREENTGSVIFIKSTPVWHVDQEAYFKEDFNDTIYHIRGTDLIPRYIFNTGEYHWPYKERYNKSFAKEHIHINLIQETKRYLFFYFNFNQEALLGIFDKKTGQTAISKYEDFILDDIHSFMPLNLSNVSASGEFATIRQISEIKEWFDKNEAKSTSLPASLTALRNLEEDDNPVVVIMHPKK